MSWEALQQRRQDLSASYGERRQKAQEAFEMSLQGPRAKDAAIIEFQRNRASDLIDHFELPLVLDAFAQRWGEGHTVAETISVGGRFVREPIVTGLTITTDPIALISIFKNVDGDTGIRVANKRAGLSINFEDLGEENDHPVMRIREDIVLGLSRLNDQLSLQEQVRKLGFYEGLRQTLDWRFQQGNAIGVHHQNSKIDVSTWNAKDEFLEDIMERDQNRETHQSKPDQVRVWAEARLQDLPSSIRTSAMLDLLHGRAFEAEKEDMQQFRRELAPNRLFNSLGRR